MAVGAQILNTAGPEGVPCDALPGLLRLLAWEVMFLQPIFCLGAWRCCSRYSLRERGVSILCIP